MSVFAGWVYHQGAINDLAFSPDGKWLTTVSNDASVFLFGLRYSQKSRYTA